MTKYTKRYIVTAGVVFISLLLSSCSENEIPQPTLNLEAVEMLKNLDKIGVYNGSTVALNFNENEHQIYLRKSSSENLFRIFTHDTGKYLDVSFPTLEAYDVGNVLHVTTRSNGFDRVVASTQEMIIVQAEGNTLRLIENENVPEPFALIIYWEN